MGEIAMDLTCQIQVVDGFSTLTPPFAILISFLSHLLVFGFSSYL